jgi:NADH-quinone oxidoreductase subunit E
VKIKVEDIEKIARKHGGERGAVIPILQDVQALYGYVPKEAVKVIARELSIFPVVVYGILTFYTQFYLTPRGEHTIKVCQGTACYVMGGKEILDHLSSTLKIKDGETTKDGKFSLERVACLGCCGMAPVIMIDKDFHGKCTIKKLDGLLEEYGLKKQ